MTATLQKKIEEMVISELAKLGVSLPIDMQDNWNWMEKEINFEGANYLIGGYVKRDIITRHIEIIDQQCLPMQ